MRSQRFVFDLDDDEFNIFPECGDAWQHRGLKNKDGTELKMDTTSLESANSLHRKREVIDQLKRNLESADLITCSTPHLGDSIAREVGFVEPLVLPNMIDFELFYDVRHNNDDVVRILWYGSRGRSGDLKLVLGPLLRVLHEFENVRLFCFGEALPAELEGHPKVQVLAPVPFSRFYHRLNALGHDIVIVPTTKHPFNLCRSAIKFYEASACSKPSVCLASRYGSIGDEIQDGRTGMLFESADEFFQKLVVLVSDLSLRRRLAAGARAWCAVHRSPESVLRRVWPRICNCLEFSNCISNQ